VHLGAILVSGKRSLSVSTINAASPAVSQRPEPEPVSLACMEVLGQSVLARIVDRLRTADCRDISVITPAACPSLAHIRNAKVTVVEKLKDRWVAAERALRRHAQRGRGTVLIAEVGAYVELDLAEVLEFHWLQRQPVTPLYDEEGPLGYWIAEATQITSDRTFHLPLVNEELVGRPYLVNRHVNRMRDPRDLRRLVVDAFLGRCSIVPRGKEIRPGVWVDEGVRLHKSARLVAPTYLGRNATVQPAALITQFSNLERRCQVGEGSVVANASVLPHTRIGRGIDVSAAVVNGSEFVDLRRNVTVRIQDANLLSDAAVWRGWSSTESREFEVQGSGRVVREPEYSGYLSRAALRLLEVFKDEA
jgi:hypothetical protein